VRTIQALVTTTWNSIDLIERYLVHYRRLGFDRAMVMDFDSTDGTHEILVSDQWRDFIDLIPFPGIALLQSSNMMLALARERYGRESWCLYCDPDELLVTPSMSIDDPSLARARADADILSIPRFNMTGLRSIARDEESRMSAADALTLRIDGRVTRAVDVDMRRDTLDPPWIFTAIPGKVLVRLGSTTSIGEGDHSAASEGGVSAAPAGVYLLHYPFRRYATFREKLEMARIGFDTNPQLSEAHGWQIRRWIRLAQTDKLYEEYLQQFIADEDAEPLLADGTLVADDSVRHFHRGSITPIEPSADHATPASVTRA
jgi:hypothetical protein